VLVGASCGAYLARALAQKYANQIDGLLLRVPLVEPDDDKRDVDLSEPLVRDEQVMASVSAEDKDKLGGVLIQTPAYIKTLKARFDSVYLPASRAADSKTLEPIRADAQRYRLSYPFDRERQKFLAPTLIICGRQDDSVGYRDSLCLLESYPRSTYAILDRGTHDLPVDKHDLDLFHALVRDWIYRVNEWRSHADKR
jgi:pimeloyl-ACP methyl ester carboxylesterase